MCITTVAKVKRGISLVGNSTFRDRVSVYNATSARNIPPPSPPLPHYYQIVNRKRLMLIPQSFSYQFYCSFPRDTFPSSAITITSSLLRSPSPPQLYFSSPLTMAALLHFVLTSRNLLRERGTHLALWRTHQREKIVIGVNLT